MRYLILLLLLAGCASNPKVRMKNCESVGNGYFDCDPIPEKHYHDRI